MEILPQLLVNSLISGSIYALATSGLALTYGLLRVLNFAHGHFMMVGAYLFFALHNQQEMSLASSILLTGLAMLFLSFIAMRAFVLPFAHSGFVLTFVSTLTLSIMLESVVSLWFGVNVRALSLAIDNQSIEWQGIYITPLQLGIIFLATGYVGLLSYLMHGTALGRKIRALQQHAPAASALGIPVQSLQFLVFGLSTISAALAGILIGLETNIQPLMGDSYTIKAFAAMILGGLGNMWGAILGSYILGVVENLSIGLSFGDWYLPSGYKDAIAFCVVLGILLVSPGGIMGRKGRKV